MSNINRLKVKRCALRWLAHELLIISSSLIVMSSSVNLSYDVTILKIPLKSPGLSVSLDIGEQQFEVNLAYK